jgi:hypothetical protein
MARVQLAPPSKCNPRVNANEHMDARSHVTLGCKINPGSSWLIHAEVTHKTHSETAPSGTRRPRPARGTSRATRGRPEAARGGGSGRWRVPRRRRGLLTSAALLPSPPNTLSSRPDPPSSHHVSSSLPPEGPRAREAGEAERMAP